MRPCLDVADFPFTQLSIVELLCLAMFHTLVLAVGVWPSEPGGVSAV